MTNSVVIVSRGINFFHAIRMTCCRKNKRYRLYVIVFNCNNIFYVIMSYQTIIVGDMAK